MMDHIIKAFAGFCILKLMSDNFAQLYKVPDIGHTFYHPCDPHLKTRLALISFFLYIYWGFPIIEMSLSPMLTLQIFSSNTVGSLKLIS